MSRRRYARLDGTTPVQFDVQNDGWSYRERRKHRLPAAGNGAGHFRQLQECPRFDQPKAALRYRANWEGLSKRDHAEKLHFPGARIRADGNRVLRHAWRRRRMASALD